MIANTTFATDSRNLMIQVISEWRNRKQFGYEIKENFAVASPVVKGEVAMKFEIRLVFNCNGNAETIHLKSKGFHTQSQSVNPLSDNVAGDSTRLKKLLDEFDAFCYETIEQKMSECIDYMADPLWLNL